MKSSSKVPRDTHEKKRKRQPERSRAYPSPHVTPAEL